MYSTFIFPNNACGQMDGHVKLLRVTHYHSLLRFTRTVDLDTTRVQVPTLDISNICTYVGMLSCVRTPMGLR